MTLPAGLGHCGPYQMEETLQQAPIAALIDYYQSNIHTTQTTQWDAVKWTYSDLFTTERREKIEKEQEVVGCVRCKN